VRFGQEVGGLLRQVNLSGTLAGLPGVGAGCNFRILHWDAPFILLSVLIVPQPAPKSWLACDQGLAKL
jgi:hypothetical protein